MLTPPNPSFPYNTRDYYESKGIKTKYTDWFRRVVNYSNLVENVDYVLDVEKAHNKKTFWVKSPEALEGYLKHKDSLVREGRNSFLRTISPSTKIPENLSLSVTSQFISDMAGVPHKDILRKIRNFREKLKESAASYEDPTAVKKSDRVYDSDVIQSIQSVLDGIQESTYKSATGESRPMFILNEHAAIHLASLMDVAVGAYITHKFIELKRKVQAYADSVANRVDRLSMRHVYVFYDDKGGTSKIGVAVDPSKRIKQVSTKGKLDLHLLYQTPMTDRYFDVERKAHEHFNEYRIDGGEWFDAKLPAEVIVEWLENEVTNEQE